MFSKKNRQALPEAQSQSIPALSQAQSLFAPAINPVPTPIDFGFGQPGQSPPDWPVEPSAPGLPVDAEPTPEPLPWPSPDAEEPDYVPPPDEQPPTSDWAMPEPGAADFPPQADFPSSLPEPAFPAMDFSPEAPQAFEPSPEPTYGAPPHQPAQPEAQAPPPAELAWEMTEVPQPADLSQPAPDFGSFAAPEPSPDAAFDMDFPQPVPALPEAYPAPLEQIPAAMPDWEMPVPPMKIEPQASSGFWDNLQTPDAMPGAQVPADPLASGQFLDSVSHQLYPDDPFAAAPTDSLAVGADSDAGLDWMGAMEGEQAFEEAAQYLFPETVSAPLTWEQDETGMAVFAEPDPFMPSMPGSLPTEPATDLGPSFQSEAAGFNDMSASYAEPAAPFDFLAPEPPAAPQTAAAPDLAEPAAPGDFEPSEPSGGVFEESAISQDWMAPADPGSEVSLIPVSPDPDYSPDDLWFPEGMPEGATAPVPIMPSAAYAGESPVTGHYLEDEEFYAASFTLTDDGEIVPEHGEYVPPAAPEPAGSFEFPSDQPGSDRPGVSDAFESVAEETAPAWGGETPGDWFGDPDAGLMEAEPAPLPEPAEGFAPVPEPVPVAQTEIAAVPGTDEPLERQWEASVPDEPVAGTPEPVTPAGDIDLDALAVLAVCGLDADKRLLLVENQGIYALMGQAGVEEPQIYVLKIFDHNPIAYQNTFTAVNEGQAGQQGMFVIQLGTWHGIVSTFQNTITLHTELG